MLDTQKRGVAAAERAEGERKSCRGGVGGTVVLRAHENKA